MCIRDRYLLSEHHVFKNPSRNLVILESYLGRFVWPCRGLNFLVHFPLIVPHISIYLSHRDYIWKLHRYKIAGKCSHCGANIQSTWNPSHIAPALRLRFLQMYPSDHNHHCYLHLSCRHQLLRWRMGSLQLYHRKQSILSIGILIRLMVEPQFLKMLMRSF